MKFVKIRNMCRKKKVAKDVTRHFKFVYSKIISGYMGLELRRKLIKKSRRIYKSQRHIKVISGKVCSIKREQNL